VSEIALEIAVQDLAGVRIAATAGVDRVELCGALALAGLTPSLGMIEAAVEAAAQPAAGQASSPTPEPSFVHVLVRPRPGGFVYDAHELQVAVRDVRAVRRAGAAGVVIGALTRNGEVDVPALRQLQDAAEGLPITFHRAFDIVPRPAEALDVLIDWGVARVLTSGQAKRTVDGLAALEALVSASAGRIEIMAGGGVRVEDIPALAAVGVDAIHLSARRAAMEATESGPGGGAAGYDVTDEGIVAAALVAARAQQSHR
jgi:copper homeostasis protein